jgi:hypothetical protein
MKFLARLMVMVILLAEAARTQQAPPSPVMPLPPTTELPSLSGAPEPQSRPVLLPESTALPAASPDLRLPSPFPPLEQKAAQPAQPAIQLSPEELQKNKVRLSEIRVIAMRNPRVIALLQQANGALTDEAKREFLRAYYHTLCTQMRKLEPGLLGTISEYERAQIRQLAQGPSRLAIRQRESSRRDRQRRAREGERGGER